MTGTGNFVPKPSNIIERRIFYIVPAKSVARMAANITVMALSPTASGKLSVMIDSTHCPKSDVQLSPTSGSCVVLVKSDTVEGV